MDRIKELKNNNKIIESAERLQALCQQSKELSERILKDLDKDVDEKGDWSGATECENGR